MKGIVRSILVWMIGVVAFLSSCVSSDIYSSNGLIPPGQLMGTYIDSTMTISTSIIALDSIATSGSGTVYLGKYNSTVFGSTMAEGASSYFGSGFSDTTALFGTSPVADSMILSLVFADMVGDSDYPLEVSVHELVDSTLSASLQYFSNRDMEGRYDPTPLVGVTVEAVDSVIHLHLPASYYDRFILEDPDDADNFYTDDSLFHDTFKGFYFKLNNPAPEGQEGRIAMLSLAHSYMTLYYRGTDSDGEIDTTSMNFFFYISDYYRGNDFSTIVHDYTTASVMDGGVVATTIGDSTLNLSRLYLQGFGGLGSRIVLDTLVVDQIRQSAVDDGYTAVALHSAKVRWTIESANINESMTPTTLDIAPARVGLYRSFLDYGFITEYDPISELQYSTTTQIGGYLNRSLATYQQDITHTMQNLFSKPTDVGYLSDSTYNPVLEMYVGMANMGTYSEAVVGGGTSVAPPEVVIVYTLVK